MIRLTQPVIDPKIRDAVPDEQVEPAKVMTNGVQNGTNDQKTEIAQQDELGILGLVQRAVHVEVVDTSEPAILLPLATTFTLIFMLIMTSDIGDEIQGPTGKLLANQVQKTDDWRLLGQFVQLMGEFANLAGILLSRLGYEDHVTAHVAGGLVMLSVRDLP